MLFRAAFHPGIRDGSIDLSFRHWRTAKARIGGRYHLSEDDVVVVDAVDTVPIGDITAAEARRSGFEGVDALIEFLSVGDGPRVTRRTRVFRVAFHHERIDGGDEQPTGTPQEIIARLAEIDSRSRRAPWTRRTLELIGEHPGISASRLATQLERDRLKFKADVRRLKALGLTQSLEVGYRLTPLGRAVLKRLR